MPNFEIRRAQEEDFPSIAQMHYPVWRESNDGVMTLFVLDMFDTPETWPDKAYKPKLSRPGWAMWIAESEGQPVGVTIFGPEAANQNLVELDSLYVARKDQGIGSSLLAKALDSQPSDDVILWCSEENRRARGYYYNRGFRLDGRTQIWEPVLGVRVSQVGYRLNRSASAP